MSWLSGDKIGRGFIAQAALAALAALKALESDFPRG